MICKNIKMIVVDLDGTLLTKVDDMSEETVAVFRRVKEAGLLPVIATGRLEKESVFAADKIGAKEYIITMNGLMIYDYQKDAQIYHRCMERESACRIFDQLDRYDVFYQVYAGNETHTTARAVRSLPYAGMSPSYMEFYANTRQIPGGMREYVERENLEVDKMFVSIEDDALRNKIRSLADQVPGVQTLSSGVCYLEILPEGADKCHAIEFLEEYTGISSQNMMIIGDSENDVKMLRMAGLAVAMGNGCSEAKAAADYIAPDNLHDGVSVAIRKFIFGEDVS